MNIPHEYITKTEDVADQVIYDNSLFLTNDENSK